jgi:hypothetical protein
MNRVTRSGEVFQNGQCIGRVSKVQGNKWVAEKRFEGGELGVAFVQVGDKFNRQSDAVVALIRDAR